MKHPIVIIASLIISLANITLYPIKTDTDIHTERKHRVLKSGTSAITHQISNARLGDHLIGYCKAKELSERYKIPLLYNRFQYGDQLGIEAKELIYDEHNDIALFKKVVRIYRLEDTSIDRDANILYILDENHWEDPSYDDNGMYRLTIKKVLQNIITPPKNILPRCKKADYITIAVHIRTGGNYKPDHRFLSGYNHIYAARKNAGKMINEDLDVVLKFPSMSFYHKQLTNVITMLAPKKLEICIYTDYQTPSAIATALSQNIASENVVYTYREHNNNPDDYILQDLFDMAQADILIRPRSGLSVMAQILGNHQLVIWPQNGHWEPNQFIIDKVGITTNNTGYENN